ncbi:MAG TPA: hypothetical protein VGH27_20625 [Streptosporangiaceae bacterium]|jgi:hypothetical protein
MAPPIPGLRRPVTVHRRTAGDVIAGLAAIIALTVLTVGVPIALITVFGLPIPHSKPTLGLLTHQVNVLTIIQILSVLVWLAWLQLLFCVFAEIRAAIRNVGVPTRVPLSGGSQAIAHRLVTAALLLFSATAALSPAFTRAAPAPPPAHTISAVAQAGANAQAAATGHESAGARAANQASVDQNQDAEKIYVVKPPVGRFHESLWEIAQNHLGNGLRYREIFELNKDHPQPDGTTLTYASLIRPGWILRMPRDASGPGIEIVNHAPGGAAGAAEQAGAAQASRATESAAGGVHGAAGDQTPATALGGGSGAASSGASGGTSGGAVGGSHAAFAPATQAGGLLPFPYELSAASLMAAGILSALGRRRREQLWQRAFGQRVVSPEGDAAMAEAALRLGASEPSVRLLDTGLRSLSQELAAQGKAPPTVFAAHLGQVNLDLWIAPADKNPPQPWVPVDDGQVWRLPLAAVAGLDPDEAGAALAPYPGLVSIGTSDTGRMLVDLEVAHGLIAVRGSRPMVQSVLAAMATELATNRWSDRMQITLIGFGPELKMLAPDRVRVAESLEEALPALEARAAEVEHALASFGTDSVLTGRSRGMHPDSWAPHYLIMAIPPTPQQRERLLALASTRHRTAMGYVVAGDVPGATWSWDVTEQGRLKAGVLGFDLRAQLLPPQQYAAVVNLFRAAGQGAGIPLMDPPPDAAPPAQLVPGSRMSVEVTMLGQSGVQAAGRIEPDRLGVATEIVMYLAAHPEGVHPNVLTGAVWPRGVTPEVRDSAISRVREWLGADPAGQPNLLVGSTGRMSLGPQVRIDWQVFRTFVALAARARPATTDGPPGTTPPGGQVARTGQEEVAYLTRALDLVHGQLLDGRDRGRYAWLAADPLEYEATARVADAAHRLGELRLAAGDAQEAMEAARAGLRLAFNDEMLWRDLLKAAHATGQEHVLRAVVGEVSARVSLDDVLPKMAPETEALIDELLPSWRSSVA